MDRRKSFGFVLTRGECVHVHRFGILSGGLAAFPHLLRDFVNGKTTDARGDRHMLGLSMLRGSNRRPVAKPALFRIPAAVHHRSTGKEAFLLRDTDGNCRRDYLA